MRNSTLTSLHLNGYEKKRTIDDAELRSLKLTGNRIGDNGARDISESLKLNSTLTSMDLDLGGDEKKKCNLSRKIVEHCVVVAEKNAPPKDRNIQAFAGYVYLGNAEDDEKCLFRAIIVDRDNSFRDLNRNRFEYNDDNLTKKMLYTDSIGYQIEKEG